MDVIPEASRNVLVSIRPIYASRILSGEKTVELRRRFPEVGIIGAAALIYSSSPIQAVVGYARIKHVLKLPIQKIWAEHGEAARISRDEFREYFINLEVGFAVLLESAKRLKREVNLACLVEQFGIVPPQSYRYITRECSALLIDDQFQAFDRHKHHNRSRRSSACSGILR
jgi:predicted transcriptional regulator